MPIPIYSPDEIDAIAHAGDVLWCVLDKIVTACQPGMTTREIDALAGGLLRGAGAQSLASEATDPAGRAFPGVGCVCVNEEVVHAVPSDRIIRDGDLVSIDLAARVDWWCADVCRSLVVGEGDAESQRLVAAAQATLDCGTAACEPGRRWSQVVRAVRAAAADAGCRLVPGLAGHGIGHALHEPPVAWLGSDGSDFVLRPGMVLTVEPVLTLGSGRTLTLDDAWTVLTEDRARAAAEERTVAITRNGPRVLSGPIRFGGSGRSDRRESGGSDAPGE